MVMMMMDCAWKNGIMCKQWHFNSSWINRMYFPHTIPHTSAPTEIILNDSSTCFGEAYSEEWWKASTIKRRRNNRRKPNARDDLIENIWQRNFSTISVSVLLVHSSLHNCHWEWLCTRPEAFSADDFWVHLGFERACSMMWAYQNNPR